MEDQGYGNAEAWFGNEDTPAPRNAIGDPAPELKIGVAARHSGAKVKVRYRRVGASWQTLEVRKSASTREAHYYTTRFPRSAPGSRVEYEVLVKLSPVSATEQRVGEISSFEVASDASIRVARRLDGVAARLPLAIVGAPTSGATWPGSETTTPELNDLVVRSVDQEEGFIVAGKVRQEDGSPAPPGTRVEAYDKDFRSRELLGAMTISGRSARYEIRYTRRQFARAEKKLPDLFVLAKDRHGNVRARSDTIFNAPKSQNIDLTFQRTLAPERRTLSLLERLEAAIKPLTGGIGPAAFTDDDTAFLAKECEGSVDQPVKPLLLFLRDADQFAGMTGIPRAAFFGWFFQDQPQELDKLLAVPVKALRRTLTTAIKHAIIPDISDALDDLPENVGRAALNQGVQELHRFKGRLLGRSDSQPLANMSIQIAMGGDQEEPDIGLYQTDSRGQFSFLVPVSATNADSPIPFMFEVLSEDLEVLGAAESTMRVTDDDVQDIFVSIRDPDAGSAAIENVISNLDSSFRALGVATVRDLLEVEGAESAIDAATLDYAQGQARMSFLGLKPAEGEALVTRGYSHIGRIATTPRDRFVREVHDALDGYEHAAGIHFAAIGQWNAMLHATSEPWIAWGTDSDDGDDVDPYPWMDFSDLVMWELSCRCNKCGSVVSPIAYLTHLVKWVVEHTEDEIGRITLGRLEKYLHQCIRQLPASCEAADQNIRQARLAVEVLWSFTDLDSSIVLPSQDGGEGVGQTFSSDYWSFVTHLYERILLNLGVSHRRLTAVQEGEKEELARILGIAPERVDELMLGHDGAIRMLSEEALEEVFGYVDSRREPFEASQTPMLIRRRWERLAEIWMTADWTEGNGLEPTIDPNGLEITNIRQFIDEDLEPIISSETRDAATELLAARKEWAKARFDSIREAGDSAATAADAFAGMLDDTELELTVDVFDSLAEMEAQGLQIDAELEQLGLQLSPFRYLARTYRSFTTSNQELTDSIQNDIAHALLSAEKARMFSQWVEEERDRGVFLHPGLFVVEDDTEEAALAQAWLYSEERADRWRKRLAARADQQAAVEQGVREAVNSAEESTITQLRDVLVRFAEVPDPYLERKADWLERRLFVDMMMDGCARTTRIAFIATTLQGFVRAAHRGRFAESSETFSISADAFGVEWPTLQDYNAWRSFVTMYIYPENALSEATPRWISHGLRDFMRRLPRRITPRYACELSTLYTEYFTDIANLSVEASCQIETLMGYEDPCEGSLPILQSRFHVFARASSSKVYWAHFDPVVESRDTIKTWRPLGPLGEVWKIAGATPHKSADKEYLLLFAMPKGKSGQLLMRPFDAENGRWLPVRTLDLPAESSTVTVIQKRGEESEFPTLVVAHTAPAGVFGGAFMRKLRGDLEGWEGTHWYPILGPSSNSRVMALIDQGEHYVIILQHQGLWDELSYRVAQYQSGKPVNNDDYQRRRIEYGLFAGAYTWPGTNDFFVMADDNTSLRNVRISSSGATMEGDCDWLTFDSIEDFNSNWLEPVLGVSLDDIRLYRFEDYAPDYFVPSGHPAVDRRDDRNPFVRTDYGGNPYPVSEEGWIDGGYYSGSILDLVTKPTLHINVGSDAAFGGQLNFGHQWSDDLFYLAQLKYYGVKKFLSDLEGAKESPKFLWWKYCDERIWELSGEVHTLADVLEGLTVNELLAENTPWEGTVAPPDSERSEFDFCRGRNDATIRRVGTFGEKVRFVSSSGQESSGEGSRTVAYTPVGIPTPPASDHRSEIGAFRVQLKRDGDTIWGKRGYRIAPHGRASFENLPVRTSEELLDRKQKIKEFYEPMTGDPISVRYYLREFFYLVPMILAGILQRSGYYEQSLEFYRLVYRYDAEDVGQRKIDYGLVLEESLEAGYAELEEFVGDSLDIHKVAGTRKQTYSRHALISIVRCLLDFGDALFATDTAWNVARAGELYKEALELLKSPELPQESIQCAGAIGILDVEIPDGRAIAWNQFKTRLANISSATLLDDALTSIRSIVEDGARPAAEKIVMMRHVIEDNAIAREPVPVFDDIFTAKREVGAKLENSILANAALGRRVEKVGRKIREERLAHIKAIGAQPDNDEAPQPTFRWLGSPLVRSFAHLDDDDGATADAPRVLGGSSGGRSARAHTEFVPSMRLELVSPTPVGISDAITMGFCVPQNPLLTALRERATNNLNKVRSCRNIAGIVRHLQPFGDQPSLENGRGRTRPGSPTIYPYSTLIARVKELVSLAGQVESRYQAAVESAEREGFSTLELRQAVEMGEAQVGLQQLRVDAASTEVGLARNQRTSAQIQVDTYSRWREAGPNYHEQAMLDAHRAAADAEVRATQAKAVAQLAEMAARAAASATTLNAVTSPWTVAAATTAQFAHAGAVAAGATASVEAIRAQATAQAESFAASFERQRDDWGLKQSLAEAEVSAALTQIALARQSVAIHLQERSIAELQQNHARQLLEYLNAKAFNEDLYRWMAAVLEDVYRYFLQEATAFALLAERQLLFERGEEGVGIIKTDYWTVARTELNEEGKVERLGMTGSSRLLKDVYELDNYAFETRKRSNHLSMVLDLAELYPGEFQSFRETGRMTFDTPRELFLRQFPGYYLALIRRVDVSIVALVPPVRGVRGALTSLGISRVVTGPPTFETVSINGWPERIGLTAAATEGRNIVLRPEDALIRQPFEGTGMDTAFELSLPKANNPFDYTTIATVLVSFQFTALFNHD